MIRRRSLLTLLGGAVGTAWPVVARGQQSERVRRIGVLISNAENDPEAAARIKAFEFGLQKLGMAKGRNLLIDYRFGLADIDLVQRVVNEMVGSAPDVVLAHSPSTVAALQRASGTVPIVFVQAADPVNLGLVTNLSRPEGNVTGFVLIEPSICGKWLQLLHDVAPKTTEVLVLQNSNNPSSEAFVRSIEAAAPPLGMIVNVTSVSDGAQIERAIAAIAGRPNVGLLVLPGPALSNERERIISLALRHHLPAIYPFKFYAIDGGLMFYGADNIDQWRQAASYVDRILRGSQPRDLPIQLPTKFDLVINLRTAKAIGLTIPRDMLLIADEMIE